VLREPKYVFNKEIMSQTDQNMQDRSVLLKTPSCKVCSSQTIFHLTKDFNGYCTLNLVVYVRCKTCGFVFSPTMYKLSEEEFMLVNASFHHLILTEADCSEDPNWLLRLKKQSIELFRLFEAGIIRSELPWLDYACGNGRLIRHLQDLGFSNIVGYEPYMKDTILPEVPTIADKDLQPGRFDCVISTSFLEHVRDLAVIERMSKLVSSKGAFIFHTYVDEQIPADPNWFYLLPTHCSFFTDGALAILFERHGFKSATHIARGNMHVWSRVEVPGFVKGRPAKYRAE